MPTKINCNSLACGAFDASPLFFSNFIQPLNFYAMPQIVETTVYLYAELPTEKAKEKAREWHTQGLEDWDTFCLENYQEEVLPALGFENAKIAYSGFSSQGDGLSFTCDVDFLKYCTAFGVSVRPMVRKLLESGQIDVSASIVRTSHHYSHENTVGAECYPSGMSGQHERLYDYLNELCAGIIGHARAKMRELYRSLEKEYDYQTSEEQIAEAMAANDYTFTESGKRFG